MFVRSSESRLLLWGLKDKRWSKINEGLLPDQGRESKGQFRSKLPELLSKP